MNVDLEFLREIFKDTRLHVGIGTIAQLGVSKDQSVLRVKINLLPENRYVIGEMTFADVCSVTFPQVDDLALVLFVDGHPDDCYVIGLVNTSEEPLPTFAIAGHTTIYSRTGNKLYLGSATKVGIGRPNIEPVSPLVLGDILKTALTALANAFINNASAIGTDNVTGAGITLSPTVVAALNSFITTYLSTTSSNILSQIAFTERGA